MCGGMPERGILAEPMSWAIKEKVMQTYEIELIMLAWEGSPLPKVYKIRACDPGMALGFCKGQAAVNGWKVLEVKSVKTL